MLVLSASLFIACEEDPPGYFEHEEADFSLVLPEPWIAQADPPGAAMVAWRGEKNEKTTTFTVVRVGLPEGANNDDFADLNFREVTGFPDYRFLKNDSVTVDGESVPALVYLYRSGGGWRQGFLTSIVSETGDGTYGYVLSGEGETKAFARDRQDYVAILSTFKRD